MRHPKVYLIRLSFAFIIGVFFLFAFMGVKHITPFLKGQFGPALLHFISQPKLIIGGIVLGWILITLLFGRFYCSLFCPLGLVQEIEMLLFHRTKGIKKNSLLLRWALALIFWGSFLGGTTALLRFVEPYSLIGNILSFGIVGLCIISFILILALPFGRFFCTHVCPVGAILGGLSKFSYYRLHIGDKCVHCGRCEQNCPAGCMHQAVYSIDNTRCVRCLKCVSNCPVGAISLAHVKKAPVISSKEALKGEASHKALNLSRRRLLKSAGLGLLCAGAVATGHWIKQTARSVKLRILPPGAGSVERFLNRCTNCNACVENCPQCIIRKADQDFARPFIEFDKSFCRFKCHRCSSVCPTGALRKLALSEKQKTLISIMNIDRLACIGCYECVKACPKKALSVVRGQRVPAYDVLSCIGCGKCQSVCQMGAITAEAIPEQVLLTQSLSNN